MTGKEAASASGADGSQEPCQLANSGRMYCQSASWLSSRTPLPPVKPDIEKDGLDPNGGNSSHGRRPLAPRSTQSYKARPRLPPLRPLTIAHRSPDECLRSGSDDIGEWPILSTPTGRDMNGNSEGLKLDLSNIHKNPEINGGLVRREKIAFFDKKCSKVAEHVFLGGDAVAKDRDILKQNGITHVLNCVGFVCPEYFKSDFIYQTLWLRDSPSEDITGILYDVFDYFEDVREQHGRVFVHCYQGVSRSTSLVIGYLMWREGQSFDDAFEYVKAARSIADPNIGFACQLLQCQKRVHASPLSPSSLLRMYRVAPHSPYDPLHLTLKMLNDPSPSALDSRGAFIIHLPSSIYVWIGKKSDAIMERDARGAVCQIVRYEKVQGPVITVMEGEEPLYFWDAFSNFLPLMDKLKNGEKAVESSSNVCPGERKVDMYNIDFEIFQIATSGGFMPPFASCETEHETHLPVRESSWSMLRRKFVSGNMKDFVFSTKSGNPSDKEAAVFGGFRESWEEKQCNERSSAVLKSVVDTGGTSCNLVKPVVYHWPSLEKLDTCSIDDLDSKGAYIFITPTSGFGKDAGRAAYVWVGRSFSCDISKIRQVDCKGLGDPGEIDWKQVASDVLRQMVLPTETNIKMSSSKAWVRGEGGGCLFSYIGQENELLLSLLYGLEHSSRGCCYKLSEVVHLNVQVVFPYKSDIPRAVWNPPLTQRGSPQPKCAARVGVSESDTPQDI
ncbi:Protein-tyrosine-phosphatase MKP1 [Capsicum baccatum]|uniref:Protein-tyrosine-phosphatase MKP1 n=1 Tax=Capsicum baccatum TaxID=33114 RepID=A0A2G2WU57_CAPBA|nr:Protein-tyrosine-phosphatase MKP1 [Capsicum baccatum]